MRFSDRNWLTLACILIASIAQAQAVINGRAQINADTPPSTGAGVEIGYSSAAGGQVVAYDRNAGAYKFLYLSGSELGLITNGTERLRVLPNGYVGIGTTSPAAKLHLTHSNERETFRIYSNNAAPSNYLSIWQGTGAGVIDPIGSAKLYLGYDQATDVYLGASGGRIGIGTASPSGQVEIKGPYNGDSQFNINSTSSNAELRFSYQGSPKGFVWYNQNNDLIAFGRGNTTTSMFVTTGGNFGFGTQTPGTFKLAVEGKIGAREVNVTTSGWSDYVFNSDYKLRPLSEVQQYIEENHHLPEVPSEKEVLANGQNLGEMNAILLKKIEELTLYVIALKNEINEIKTGSKCQEH